MKKRIPNMKPINEILPYIKTSATVEQAFIRLHDNEYINCTGLKCTDCWLNHHNYSVLSLDNLADLLVAGHTAQQDEFPEVELEIGE